MSPDRIAIFFAIVAAVWWQMRRGGWATHPFSGPDRAEGILRERFARGEIDEPTYREQLAELRRSDRQHTRPGGGARRGRRWSERSLSTPNMSRRGRS